MPYWVLRLRWSQTDDEVCIVQAINLDAAKAKVANLTIRHIDFLGGPVERIIS